MADLCAKCGWEHKHCKGHNKRGLPCAKAPMVEQRVCYTHGGNSPQALAKAEERKIEKRVASIVAATLGDDFNPSKVDPMMELLRGLAIVIENERVLAQKVEEAGFDDSASSVHKETLYNRWERAIERRRTFAEGAIKSGAIKLRVELQEAEKDLAVRLFEGAMEAIGLDTDVRVRMRLAIGQQAQRLSLGE